MVFVLDVNIEMVLVETVGIGQIAFKRRSHAPRESRHCQRGMNADRGIADAGLTAATPMRGLSATASSHTPWSPDKNTTGTLNRAAA